MKCTGRKGLKTKQNTLVSISELQWRSYNPEGFFRKGVLENFENFIQKLGWNIY